MNHLLSISAMPAYLNRSVEQIRLQDYISAGRLNSEGLYPHLMSAAASEPTSSEATTPTTSSAQSSDPNPAKKISATTKAAATAASSDPTVTAPNADPSQEIYAKVLAFYERYNPSKIASIPAILLKYKGREKLLLEKLDRKYALGKKSAPPTRGNGEGTLSPRSDVDSAPASPAKSRKDPSNRNEEASGSAGEKEEEEGGSS
jgi:hypothetical protein